MKWVNQKYNDHINDLGRQFNATLYLYNNDMTYVNAFGVDKVNYNAYGDMCRTAMQEYTFECDTDLEALDLSNNRRLILKTELRETGAVGPTSPPLYIVEKKYSEDKKTYEYKMCDAMIKTMIPFDWDAIVQTSPNTSVTFDWMIRYIIRYVLNDASSNNYNLNDLPNSVSNCYIYKKDLEGLNLTCRDVLDMILELCGTGMRVHQNKYGTSPWFVFQCVDPTNATSYYTANEDTIRDDLAYAKEKYGPVNSILFESEISESDNLERKDDTSIANNGITQYKVSGNYILNNDNRATIIDMLYNRLNGFEYYLCDLNTTGYMALEIYDNINISLNNTNYLCKLTKNTFILSDGLIETIVSEKPTETYEIYESGSPYDDKKARIDVDKLKGEIVLKTNSNGKLAQVRLDSSGDSGSTIQLSADNIDLTGYITASDLSGTGTTTINGSNITTGQINCDLLNGGTINGQKFKGSTNESVVLQIGTDSSGTMANNNSMELIYNNDNSKLLGIYGKFWNTQNLKTVYFSSSTTRFTFLDGIVSAVRFDSSSLEEIKKNFEKLPSGLDIIKDIDIYKYHYKIQSDDEKKNIGLVIGDNYKYSKEITNEDNSSVNLYSFVSVCCKAIQEQQKEIEELKSQIEKLSKKMIR